MKKLILLLILFPSMAFAVPPMEKTVELSDSLLEPLIRKGKILYQENGCNMCHGEQGRGDGPVAGGLDNKPRNFQEYEEMKRMPTIRMEQAIKNGLAGTAMPAFKHFTDAQVEALVAYLRSFLVKSYTSLNMCAFQTFIIDAEKLEGPITVEVDEPEKFLAKIKGKRIIFRGKVWPELLAQKVHRTHFRIMQNNKIHSVISVKITSCNADLIELLKTLPCEKSESESSKQDQL